MIVQNLEVQRGLWLSFLCCSIICELEKTICTLPCLKFMLNSIKSALCANEPAARNLCNERLGVLCYRLSLNCLSESYVNKPICLFKRGGRVPKSFFFEKPNKTMSFFRSVFQSTLLKHAGEVFLVVCNADFFKFKNASELS